MQRGCLPGPTSSCALAIGAVVEVASATGIAAAYRDQFPLDVETRPEHAGALSCFVFLGCGQRAVRLVAIRWCFPRPPLVAILDAQRAAQGRGRPLDGINQQAPPTDAKTFFSGGAGSASGL